MKIPTSSLLLTCLLVVGCNQSNPPQPASNAASAKALPVTYSKNNLTPAERENFYHLPEGSELFPVVWILYMDNPHTNRPFVEDLVKFGLIPDPEGPLFDGTQVHMPVGIVVKDRPGLEALKPIGLDRMVGVNCAACHVGQLQYNGKVLRVDGGPNMFDIVEFLQEIRDTATSTYSSPMRLWAYLRARIKAGRAPAEGSALDTDKGWEDLKKGSDEDKTLAGDIEEMAGSTDIETAANDISKDEKQPQKIRMTFAGLLEEASLTKSYLQMLKNFSAAQNPATIPGFGRADAFNTARVLLFGEANKQPLAGPSSFPYIWNMQKTAWFHWPSNTNSVMQRNIGEALGLGASFDPMTGDSTIDFYNLFQLEQLAYKTTPPAWPEDLLGKIDNAKADLGEKIYRGGGEYAKTGNCIGCHEKEAKPSPEDPNLINFALIPLNTVQTDDQEVKDWVVPVSIPGKLLGESRPTVQMDFGQAQSVFISRIERSGIERFNKEHPELKDKQIQWESGRTAKPAWRIAYADPKSKELGYPAKPLKGVWATPPFLHNGSVPSIADLLTPPEQRPAAFLVGTREYDPQKMGYRTDVPNSCANCTSFSFDTTKPGNSKQGHPFGTTLKPEEKQALMEYLKRL